MYIRCTAPQATKLCTWRTMRTNGQKPAGQPVLSLYGEAVAASSVELLQLQVTCVSGTRLWRQRRMCRNVFRS